jgi:hypothetical protein
MLISFKNNKKTHSFYYVYSMDLLAIIGMETYRHGPPTRLSIQVIGSGYQSYTWNVKLEVIDLMVIHYLLHLIPCTVHSRTYCARCPTTGRMETGAIKRVIKLES